jgi:hypothetical protein
MVATCLRDPARSVEDPATGRRVPLLFEPGIQPWGRPRVPGDLSPEDLSATFPDQAPSQVAKFWVERLPANTVLRLKFSPDEAPSAGVGAPAPSVTTNALGWPVSAQWPGMTRPLFLEGFGDVTTVAVQGFAPRHLLADIRAQRGEARERLRRDTLRDVASESGGPTEVRESPYTVTYTQPIRHPRFQWATRVLEVWKGAPRARLTLRLNRISSAAPEIVYLDFPLPTGSGLPRLSCGGQPFTPFTDQLEGTCRDYFAVDGWADYETAAGRWLWVTRDAPLVAFGDAPTLALRQAPPEHVHRLRAMLFNNFWYTNFVADEHGVMEFQFDLVWQPRADGRAQDLADALVTEPVMLINPSRPEDPRLLRNLYQP